MHNIGDRARIRSLAGFLGQHVHQNVLGLQRQTANQKEASCERGPSFDVMSCQGEFT